MRLSTRILSAVLLCGAIAAGTASTAGEAPFTISPASLDLAVLPGGTTTAQLTLTNTSSDPLPYVVSSDLPAYEARGTPYVWTDIRATGIPVPDLASWPYPTIPLGFDFPFYGNSFTHCNASYEGFLSFGAPFSPWYYGTLPHNGAPPNLIAFYMAQIYGSILFLGTDAQSALHYQQLDADTTAIQFTDLVQTQTGARVTCQVQLRRDGSARIFYQDIDPTDAILVGVQNQTQDQGIVFVSPDSASGWDDGHAIEIVPGGWLSLPEPSGTLAVGESRQVPVVLGAESWRRGGYQTTVQVSAGVSGGSPWVRQVPVTMTVTDMEPTQIAFASSFAAVREGCTTTLTLHRNGGSSGAVSVEIARSTVPGSSADPSEAILAGTVHWADGETGEKSVTVAAVDDRLAEPSEVLLLRLRRPTGGATLATGRARQCHVTILDNDSRLPPRPWSSTDLGPSQAQGSSSFRSGILTVAGGGSGIGGRADAFRSCHRPLRGDGVLIARLDVVQRSSGRALAGIMLRQDLTAGAAHVFLGLSPDQRLRWLRRGMPWGSTRSSGAAVSSGPRWLRLERLGATVTASSSADGITWIDAGTAQLPAGPLLAGLAVCSGDARLLSAASFAAVTVLPYPAQ